MLTKEENEMLTRVGKGTPMGEFFRKYWLPVGSRRSSGYWARISSSTAIRAAPSGCSTHAARTGGLTSASAHR